MLIFLRLYFYDTELPEQRARLYRRCVDIMLYEKLRPDELGKTLAEWAGKPEFKRDLLARLAFELHYNEQGNSDKEQAAAWLADGFSGEAVENRNSEACKFLDAVTVRGTLLQERDGQFGFGRQHLTFQEFLAGYHLGITLLPEDRQKLWPILIRDDRWREPIRLAIGATMPDSLNTCLGLLKELLNLAVATDSDPATRLAGYKLAAEGLLDLGEADRRRIRIEVREKIIKDLTDCLFKDNPITRSPDLIQARISAAQTLARLGDPRPGVGLDKNGLPDIAWVHIPAGPFLMGSDPQKDKDAREDEQPQHEVTLPTFWISQYPVTNVQYRAFVDDKGYENEDYWREARAHGHWQNSKFKGYLDDQWRDRAYDFGVPFNLDNHPVVGISWYEAVAFCRWLEEGMRRRGEEMMKQGAEMDEATREFWTDLAAERLQVRLPTEAEWEKAASWEKRDKYKRVYPWGDDAPDPNRSNYSATGLGTTSAVGCFLAGATPYGCLDMAGNVWEWCATRWGKEYPYEVTEGEWSDTYLKDDTDRVLRGGSWDNSEVNLRCASRVRYGPNDWDDFNGYRLVGSPSR